MTQSTFLAGFMLAFTLGVLQGMWLDKPVILLACAACFLIWLAVEAEETSK